LIDVAEMNWNSSKVCISVAKKIRKIMGSDFRHIDYLVVTHHHMDHIGNPRIGGVWGLIEKQGFTVGKLIDRDAGDWVDKDNDGKCDYKTEIDWNYAGTTSNPARRWLCYVNNPANKDKLNREIAIVGSTNQIDMDSVTVEVIQSDGEGVLMKDGVTSLKDDLVDIDNHPSENDYSITLKVTFGKLDYVTGGDTDGEYLISPHNYSYNNVESVIAPRIGDIEILRVNHHGSSHSTNQTYYDTLKPEVALISCGYKNRHKHPTQSVLNRLLKKSDVYLTDKGHPTRDYGDSKIVRGDIVVISKDGINYTVAGRSYKVPTF